MSALTTKVERAIDTPIVGVRLALWLVWLVAAIPCFLLSFSGIVYGGYMLFRVDDFGIAISALATFAMGMCGIFGILGAAIRLANRATLLANENLRRRTAKTGLFAGVFVSLFPLKAALSGSPWNLLLVTPFCIGVTILIGTISIGKCEGAFN